MQELFGGEYIKLILCLDCLNLRTVEQKFMDLSMELESRKITAVKSLLEDLDEKTVEINVVDMEAQKAVEAAKTYVSKLINKVLKPKNLVMTVTKEKGTKWGTKWDPDCRRKRQMILHSIITEDSLFKGIPEGSRVIKCNDQTAFADILYLLQNGDELEIEWELPFEPFKVKEGAKQNMETKGTQFTVNLEELFPVSETSYLSRKFDFADSLRQFSEAEALTGDNKYSCEHCNCKTDALTRTILVRDRVPPVLSLQLNRFAAGIGGRGSKNQRELELPERFVLPCGLLNSKIVEENNYEDFVKALGMESEQIATSDETDVTDFELTALVVHLGMSLNSGHYVAYVKKKKANGGFQWYYCSDSHVSPVGEPPYGDAYVCIYQNPKTAYEDNDDDDENGEEDDSSDNSNQSPVRRSQLSDDIHSGNSMSSDDEFDISGI